MSKKIKAKEKLLIIYGAIMFLLTIVFVPVFEVWGREQEIIRMGHLFLFLSFNGNGKVNGFDTYYVIDYLKALYRVGAVTLLFAVMWKLLSEWEKSDKTQ